MSSNAKIVGKRFLVQNVSENEHRSLSDEEYSRKGQWFWLSI